MASTVLVFTVLRLTILIAAVACNHTVTFREDDPITVIGPPVSAMPAVVHDDAIVIRADLQFAADASLSPASFAVLDQVALLSKHNPNIKTIVVEHVELSPARTNALLAYLVQHGVGNDIVIASAPR